MTVPPTIDPALPWHEQIDRAEPDLLRPMMKMFVQSMMAAEADAICVAGYGERSAERVNSRNGYRPREWTPAPARWNWRSRSCVPGRTSRTDCSSAASEPSGR
jgi:hypothetical protein